MNWTDAICSAIRFIEDHITDELTVDMIADRVNISPFYFQKGFAMLCGFTISEYIRNRRLALAGKGFRIPLKTRSLSSTFWKFSRNTTFVFSSTSAGMTRWTPY